jgi:hypothetical protein
MTNAYRVSVRKLEGKDASLRKILKNINEKRYEGLD